MTITEGGFYMESIIILSIFMIIGIIMGVIYARIAGYVGSSIHLTDILKILLRLIQKIGDKVKRVTS